MNSYKIVAVPIGFDKMVAIGRLGALCKGLNFNLILDIFSGGGASVQRSVHEENADLRKENADLRKENDDLRKQAAEDGAAAAVAAKEAQAALAAAAAAAVTIRFLKEMVSIGLGVLGGGASVQSSRPVATESSEGGTSVQRSLPVAQVKKLLFLDYFINHPIYSAVQSNDWLKLNFHRERHPQENLSELMTKSNCTPLHLAAYLGNTELFPYLIRIGIDPTVQNTLGQTYLEVPKNKVFKSNFTDS